MTREERAVELFNNGYNCAQAVLGAFCEDMGLDLTTALKLASGFGSGVRSSELCGAVMAIGLKCGFYIEKDFEQKAYCNKKAYEFIEKFKEANNSVLCRDLLGVDIRCPDDHIMSAAKEAHQLICPRMVASAVKVLESMTWEEQ